MATLSRLSENTRASFVAAPVREHAVTTQLLDAVFPFFPKGSKCIAGYLDDGDQYWKINYHWDYLLTRIEKLRGIPELDADIKSLALAVQTRLLSNPPVPPRGYAKDARVGDTKDKSSAEAIEQRHALLAACKRDFEHVIVKAGLVDRATKLNPAAREKPWWLAVAPVARPGRSTHGTGYALDIAGNNARISEIATALGATLAFNEASHVHVEFKNWQATLLRIRSHI